MDFLLSEAGLSGADAVAISFTGQILEIAAWLPWVACACHFDRQCAAFDCKDVPENGNSGSWK
jgi:hypothetical protein